MADINQQYWIVKGKSAINRVINICFVCHIWNVNAERQQMNDLPCHRVGKRQFFQLVETDFMSSVAVSIGRSQVKRYICIGLN